MKKYLVISVLTCLLASSALADKIDGQFICERNYADGSMATLVLVIEGNTLKIKRLGDDDTWYSHHKLIHVGKQNEFKAFVTIKNSIVEDIVTITYDPETGNGEYHYSEIDTAVAWGSRSRVRYGKCDKI